MSSQRRDFIASEIEGDSCLSTKVRVSVKQFATELVYDTRLAWAFLVSFFSCFPLRAPPPVLNQGNGGAASPSGPQIGPPASWLGNKDRERVGGGIGPLNGTQDSPVAMWESLSLLLLLLFLEEHRAALEELAGPLGTRIGSWIVERMGECEVHLNR